MEEILRELKFINQRLNCLQTQCDANVEALELHAKEIQESREMISELGKTIKSTERREGENRPSLAEHCNNGFQEGHHSSTNIQQGDEITLNDLSKVVQKSTGIFFIAKYLSILRHNH